jgi:hypothetical protein
VSFLADPPLLYAAGEAYARNAPESAQGRTAGVVGAGVVAAFVGVSLALWLDQPWVRPLWRAFGARNGTDYQVGGNWLLHVDAVRKPGPREHALAGLGFLTYPLWYWLGWDHGRRARP